MHSKDGAVSPKQNGSDVVCGCSGLGTMRRNQLRTGLIDPFLNLIWPSLPVVRHNWSSAAFFPTTDFFCLSFKMVALFLHIPSLVFQIDVFFRCKFSVECDVYHCPRTICPWGKRGSRKKAEAWPIVSHKIAAAQKPHTYNLYNTDISIISAVSFGILRLRNICQTFGECDKIPANKNSQIKTKVTSVKTAKIVMSK